MTSNVPASDLMCEWYSNFLWTKLACLLNARVGPQSLYHVGSWALQLKRPLAPSSSPSAT
jgi:hypothetical protein